MNKLKYLAVDNKRRLSVLKWLFLGASSDMSHPVLQSLHIQSDGTIETANGFQLHWVHDPDLADDILEAVEIDLDKDGVMIKPVKIQQVSSFEPDAVVGSYPDIMRIIPPGAPATFVVDAKKLSDAVSGFTFIVNFAFDEETRALQISGNTKADNAAHALIYTDELEDDLQIWTPHLIPKNE